eukprot:Gb_15582 [translate_table: standard]
MRPYRMPTLFNKPFSQGFLYYQFVEKFNRRNFYFFSKYKGIGPDPETRDRNRTPLSIPCFW